MKPKYFSLFFAVLIIALASFCGFINNSTLAGQPDGLVKALQVVGFAPLASTGQTESFVEGDDGDLQKGIAPMTPRYIDNGDGTVSDTLTNLMWTKSAQPFSVGDDYKMTWEEGITACNNMILDDYDDWRMPNVREMHSLIDFNYFQPCLTDGHPFTDVPEYPGIYWTKVQ